MALSSKQGRLVDVVWQLILANLPYLWRQQFKQQLYLKIALFCKLSNVHTNETHIFMIITTYLHKYIMSDVMCRLPILLKKIKTTTLKHVKILK